LLGNRLRQHFSLSASQFSAFSLSVRGEEGETNETARARTT
jgi:hypothetical protein